MLAATPLLTPKALRLTPTVKSKALLPIAPPVAPPAETESAAGLWVGLSLSGAFALGGVFFGFIRK